MLLYIAINLTPVQNWIVKKVAKNLSDKLHTTVKVDHVRFSLFNKMIIEGVLIKDLNKDTLLYSGSADVKITDWFFLKDKATLKYIGLNNTLINLKRTDSVWNYQFLIDYFSSPKKNTANKNSLSIDLKILQIKNLHFNKIDKWIGKDMVVAVKKLDIIADNVNFIDKKILIDRVDAKTPIFSQYSYLGNRPILIKSPSPTVDTATPPTYQWNTAGWQAAIKNIDITNGIFNNERKTERAIYTDRFDGQHLRFYNISGNIKNIKWQQDTIKAIVSLSTDERSGLHVKKLKANMLLHPQLMEFSNLSLEINNSILGNYFAMRYDNMGKSMADFLHSVTLTGDFKNSKINTDDLSIFAPPLKRWNTVFYIEGSAKGTIDNLSTKNMVIKNGTTYLDGSISLKGLPDIANTFIDFNTKNLQTTYNDLITFIPALKKITQPKISKLGNIYYKGNFTGFINDFVTFGSFNTNLGSLTADINMKLPANKTPTYSGKISTTAFKLGEFVGNNVLGNITADGTLIGSSFKGKDLNANFVGKIKNIEVNKYNYQDIDVNGVFKAQNFTGRLNINDPNLQLQNLQGIISLNKENTQFNFDATLKAMHLKALKLTDQNFSLAGHFNLNFTGNNIDNFLGTAKVFDATLYNDSSRLSFDSLTIKSLIANDRKYLSIQSNELDASLSGKFKILELPDAFKIFLSRYYPSYVQKPTYFVANQDFDFSIQTKYINNYIQLINKKLKGFDNASITGHLRLDSNELNINAAVPEFSYDGKTFINTALESKGNISTLFAKISVGDIGVTDSLHFPATDLSITATNNISNIELKTRGSKAINEAELNASIQTLKDGVIVHFFPSSFIINEQKWQLEKDGELSIRKNFINANEVYFTQGEQAIAISTELDDETSTTNLVAKLKKIHIYDFLPLVLKQPKIEGLLTGNLILKDPFGKKEFSFDGNTDGLLFENKPIGKVELNATMNPTTGIIDFNAAADNSIAKFTSSGKYNMKDSLSNNQIDISITADKIELNTLEPYLNSIFSNVNGTAVGFLKLNGNKKHILLTGSATVAEASLKVLYTQCTYKIKNETIIFNPDEIDLGTINLFDLYGNRGTATGKLYHNFFKEFQFDGINVQSNKMLLLNTTKTDNTQFYGRVVGSAKMSINGPATDIRMNIDGKPSNNESDSSHIYIPSGNSKEIGAIDYIEFIQFGSKMENERLTKQGASIFVNMNIAATPACKIDVILDEATGDIIKASGSGNLNIRVGNKEPLSIRGKYEIDKGEYTFNFQQFVEKGFTLKRGGYISWDKPDPFDATISIDAEYKAKDVDFKSLPSVKGYTVKSDVDVIAHLTNTLKSPEINFEFVLPSNSPYAQDNFIKSKLEDYTRDKNEMNKQISSVLIFNTFVPPNQGVLQNQNALSIGINTIGQILSRSLTGYVNRYLQKIGLTFNFDVSSSNSINGLNESYSQLQAAANFAFSKQWFKGKLIVTVGGNVDVNNPYALSNKNTSSSLLLTPDFSAEWLLSKDGKVRVIGFRRSNIDFSTGQRNRQGLSLNYRTDFDKFSDIFNPPSAPIQKNKMPIELIKPSSDTLQ